MFYVRLVYQNIGFLHHQWLVSVSVLQILYQLDKKNMLFDKWDHNLNI